MTYFAFAAPAHIRNVVLCALATLTLAACGSGGGSSGSAATSAAAGSDSVASLVSPNAGTVDRSSQVTAPTSTGTATAGTPSTATVSSSGSTTTTTPAAGTTVASTPAKTTTTTGVATLDWLPPTENSDGSVLTNLAGYTVYYGTSPNSLTQSVKVTNPGLTAYTMTNLPSGTWYFAVTSYSSTGVESTRTSTVSTTI